MALFSGDTFRNTLTPSQSAAGGLSKCQAHPGRERPGALYLEQTMKTPRRVSRLLTLALLAKAFRCVHLKAVQSDVTQDASGNMTGKTQYAAITGDVSNGSDAVSSVSSGDIALLMVGAIVRHEAFPAGTTVATIGTTSFTASANATATASGATIFISQAESTAYAWDEDDRLLEVAHTGASPFTVTNTYDSFGRWLTRTEGSDVTKFEWDGFDCIRETAPDDTVTTYYIPQGELMSFKRGDETYQVHSCALGCVSAVTDSAGAVVSHFEYDAWGNVLSGSDGVPGGMAYRFVGGLGVRADSTTGLHYMRNRWYDAGLGRFVSRDPISLLGGWNLYAYVSNNPVSFTDPKGLDNPGNLDATLKYKDLIYESAARTGLPAYVNTPEAIRKAPYCPKEKRPLVRYSLVSSQERGVRGQPP